MFPTDLGMPVPSPLQTAADRLVNSIYVVLDSTFRYAGVYTAVCRVGSRDGIVQDWLGIHLIEVLHPQKLKTCNMDVELTASNFSLSSFFRAPEARTVFP